MLIQSVVFTTIFFKAVVSDRNCSTHSGDSKYEGGNNGQQYCVTETAKGIKENERRILLIGKTGTGKSTTGNAILNNRTFHASLSGMSVTSKTQLGEATRFGRKLLVVDTPGLFDTKKSNKEVVTEIAKCYGMTSPGIHAIILVLKVDRFTEEEQKTVKFFLGVFGEDVRNYLLVVFAGKDQLSREGMTIKQFVDGLENGSPLKTFLSTIKNRYIAFGIANQEEREGEVVELLDMIDQMVKDNGNKYYTNEMYREAEQINEEQIKEKERLAREQHQKEIDQAVEKFREESAKKIGELEAQKDQQKADFERQLREKEQKFERQKLSREERFRQEQRQGYESGVWVVIGALVSIVTMVFHWLF